MFLGPKPSGCKRCHSLGQSLPSHHAREYHRLAPRQLGALSWPSTMETPRPKRQGGQRPSVISLLSGIDCGKYLITVSFLTDGRCHRRRVIYAVGYFPRPTAGREGQRSYRQRDMRPVFLFFRGISGGRCGFRCGQRRRGW